MSSSPVIQGSGPLAQEPKAPFFAKIPAEIRNKIYRFAFLHKTMRFHTDTVWMNNSDRRMLWDHHKSTTFSVGSLFVNKQFYAEASEVVFRHGQFIVPIKILDFNDLRWVSQLGSYLTTYLTVPTKHVPLYGKLTYVEFDVCSGSVQVVRKEYAQVDVAMFEEIFAEFRSVKTVAFSLAGELYEQLFPNFFRMPDLEKRLTYFQKSHEDIIITLPSFTLKPAAG